MLVILTTTSNFTNILQTAFSYKSLIASFYALTVCVCMFANKVSCKMLVKLSTCSKRFHQHFMSSFCSDHFLKFFCYTVLSKNVLKYCGLQNYAKFEPTLCSQIFAGNVGETDIGSCLFYHEPYGCALTLWANLLVKLTPRDGISIAMCCHKVNFASRKKSYFKPEL